MEAFMRDYYITRRCSTTWATCSAAGSAAGPRIAAAALGLPALSATHRQEIDGFVLENGELEAPPPGTFSRRAAAARARLPARAAAQRRARRGAEDAPAPPALHDQPRVHLPDRGARNALLAIFSRKGQVGHALRTMHELGFLGRFFPEFRALTCLVQHEFFHRYTADEHTLVCIEMLDRIIDAKDRPSPSTSRCCSRARGRTSSISPCCCTTPGRSENTARHAEASAVNAVRVARRMRITGTDLSTLVFLVDHHLTMSEIARRKNLDNEETIIEFARIVQTQERLDLLMLLTFADTQGTGAARSYSDWKDLLLWQLYHRTTQRAQRREGIRRSASEGAPRDPAAAAEESRPPVRSRRGRGPFRQSAAQLFRDHVGGADPRAHLHRPRLPEVPDHPRRRLAAAR